MLICKQHTTNIGIKLYVGMLTEKKIQSYPCWSVIIPVDCHNIYYSAVAPHVIYIMYK